MCWLGQNGARQRLFVPNQHEQTRTGHFRRPAPHGSRSVLAPAADGYLRPVIDHGTVTDPPSDTATSTAGGPGDDGPTESFSPLLPTDVEELARRVLEKARARGLSVATAESCTGGMLASLLTDVKAASGVFERGFVVYSDPAKCELLGLRQADIDRWGAVSEEVAVAMAEGALEHSLADIAIATTGYADDGPEPGLVHFACATRTGATGHRAVRFGAIGRGPVRVESMRVALSMMDQSL
jgi:nicotinamide-nucleotide amidase